MSGSEQNTSDTKKTNMKKNKNGFLKISIPGLGFLRKFQQYRRLPKEPAAHHLEEELERLTCKIDNLLNRIDSQELELPATQEEECVVCGTNKATMQTLPCAHKVVCRQCFVRTIQMAVALKRLPLRCILCRAKVLKLHQDGKREENLPKSVSGYNIANNISSFGSNYSFTSGVSAVSSESSSSRKSSIVRDFSFSSLSNFQNVNLLNKSQIPRSKSGSFASRQARQSRSPSPAGNTRSRSVEGGTPSIKIDQTPSDESLFSVSPVSPSSPGPYLPKPSPFLPGSRSPWSPTSPISPIYLGDGERVFCNRGTTRLSTPLSPIKESRKEMGSLGELQCSPCKEVPLKLQDAPRRPSSRIRCTEKIISQLDTDTLSTIGQSQSEFDNRFGLFRKYSKKGLKSLESEDPEVPNTKIKTIKSVSFKD